MSQRAPDPGQDRIPRTDEGPDDEALDAYILTRLRALGVDLSVLPEDDETAPADRRRILRSARRFLRATPGAIAALELDPLGPPPAIYPPRIATRDGRR